jgi:hypothetical protein
MMKKPLISGAMLIVILVVVAVGAYMYAGGGLFSTTGTTGEFTIASISPTKIFSTPTDVQDGYFIVNAIAGTGNQRVIGQMSASEIKSETGVSAENGFIISLETLEESVKYPIRRETGQDVFRYEVSTYDRVGGLFGSVPACPSGEIVGDILVQNLFGYDKYRVCIERKLLAYTGTIDNPTISFDANVGVKIGSDPLQTAKICSAATCPKSVAVGNIGSAVWAGSLATGNPIPSPAAYRAYYSVGTGKWGVAKATAYADYRTAYADTERLMATQAYVNKVYDNAGGFYKYVGTMSTSDPLFETSTVGKQTVVTVFNIGVTNTKATAVNSAHLEVSNFWPTSGDSSAGSLTATSLPTILNPTFVFKLKASEIGVLVSSGQPSITSLSCPKFESGQEGNLDVTVKNIGGQEGLFSASVSGCDFRILENQNDFPQLTAGETATISIPIDADTAGKLSDYCKVTVVDVEDPTRVSTKSITCTATLPTCGVGGSQFIEGTCVKECQSDGTAKQAFCCPQEVTRDASGKYVCSTTPIIQEDEETFVSWVLVIAVIFSLVAFIIVYVYANPIKKINRKYGKYIVFGLALLAAVVVFFMVPAIARWVIGLFSFGV